MNKTREMYSHMREESGKKLTRFTVLTLLLVVVIVFFAILLLSGYYKMSFLDQYIREVPKIVTDREAELDTRSAVYDSDVLSRGELGYNVYREEDGTEAEKLDRSRRMVYAESVSLVDGSGNVLETTGPVTPQEMYEEVLRKLEPRKTDFEIFSVRNKEGEDTDKKDGKAYVRFPLEGEGQRSLVFEFSCEPLLEVYNTLGSWSGVLERMLSGMEAYSFIKTEDELVGYPLNDIPEEEIDSLYDEVSGIFNNRAGFFTWGNRTACRLIILRKRPCLAMLLPNQEQGYDTLLAIPLRSFMVTSVITAATLSVFIALCLVLFQLYALQLAEQENDRDNQEEREDREDREAFRKRLLRKMRPGLLILLLGTACFSVLLLLLESRSTIAYIAMSKQLSVQYEIDWHQKQESMIRSSYSGIYKTRSMATAEFLMANEDYRSRRGLQELCADMGADYLMLFDREGNEILSSNSYTGFSLDGKNANMSEEYRAVLLGYPSVIVGPAKDPYSGKVQMGTAILMTTEDGEPDGFLLSVFSAEDLQKEIDSVSLENTVNKFAVVKGYKVAVINNEDGTFLAHTDSRKIGLDASHYLPSDVYGDDFEGFTIYDGRDVYVSGVSDNGKSLLFIVPDRPNDDVACIAVLLIVALLAILAFFYCPKACVLCAKAMDESLARGEQDDSGQTRKKSPLWVFAYGFIAFFTVLAIFAFITAYMGEWTAFVFVFGEVWSRGIHLFSIWAVLFFVAVTLSISLAIRAALNSLDEHLGYRPKTVVRLADSFVAYATGGILIFNTLYMFGVDTAALLASAGIVSIAVGMGAKDMIADILAGLFLAVEDSIHMGDVVMIGTKKGCVTDMGIRTTKITDESQNVMILNNSHISDVTNMSRRKTVCTLELELGRSVGMAQTEQILGEVIQAASEEIPEMYGSLNLDGIFNITADSCTVRLSYACSEVVRESVTKRLQDYVEKHVKEGMDEAVAEQESDSDSGNKDGAEEES